MNYYISDLHLGHENIIRLSNRPFKNSDEMDAQFIENWNSVITDDDDVYIVGDFCYKSGKNPKQYLDALKGKKHLITGNHDGRVIKDPVCRRQFVSIDDMLTINDNGHMVILCHYPMVEWNGFFRNSIHIYGHIHNNVSNNAFKIMCQIPNAYNAGIDILEFYPRTLDEVIKYNQKFISKNTK